MPSKNHQGTPFMAVSTTVSRASSGAMRGAISANAGAFTAMTTTSCGPSSRGSSATRAGAVRSSPPISSRQPRARKAAAVAPRATADTALPDRASRVPMKPPIAPAPTMQIFITPWPSAAIGRVDAVDDARQRVEGIPTRAELRAILQRIARAFRLNVLGNVDDSAHGGRRHLDLAGTVQCPQDGEAARHRVAPGEETVIAQDHRRLVADVAHEAGALVGVHGDAFEIVVGDFAEELRRIEIARRQPALGAGNGEACRGVRVHHAMRAGDAVMDRRMDGEARRVHRPV